MIKLTTLKQWIPASIKKSIKTSPLFLKHRSHFTNIYHCSVYRTGSCWLSGIFSDPRTFRYSALSYQTYFQRIFGTSEQSDETIHYKFPYSEPFPERKIISIYASYDSYCLIPKPENYKTFFVFRDPRDIVVSHYFISLRDSKGQENRCISHIIDRLERMGLFSSLKSWTRASNDPNVLLLRFEELTGPEQFNMMKRLFVHCDILMPDQVLRNLLRDHRFEVLSGGRKPGEEDQNAHYRKGIAGDWKNHFQPNHLKQFKAVTGDLLTVTGYEDISNGRVQKETMG